MGFFSSLVSATVKTVLTPVAIVKDVVEVATGNEPDNTSSLIEGIVEDIGDSFNDLADGEL